MKKRSFTTSLAWKLSFIVVVLMLLIAQIEPTLAQPIVMVDSQSDQTQAPLPAIGTSTFTRTPTPINIGNFVWDDLDQDGRQDGGEPGLGGVTVQLWNSAKTSMIDFDVTNASGIYTVIAPIPGNYRVRVVLPGASDSFSPKNMAGGDDILDSDINPTGTSSGFTDIISIASNVISMSSIDAGIIKFKTPTPTRTPTPVHIGNFIWNDLDKDGVQDAGEPGLAGIIVQLWNPTKTSMLSATTTNASGIYTVVAPFPGNYRIRVVLPSGAGFSPKDSVNATDLTDSDINPSGTDTGFTNTFTIASNVISTVIYDAGLINVPSTSTPTRTPTKTPTKTPSPTPTPTPTPITVSKPSLGNQDGEIQSNNGTTGTVVHLNSLRIGDLATANHPLRGILSFNLSLPANATIVSAEIRMFKTSSAGSPFTSLGNLKVDIANPKFGNSAGLAIEDFQASSSANGVAILKQVGTTDTYTGKLNTIGIGLINKNGTTQFRLRFTSLTDLDLQSDFIKFFGGEHTTASERPKLIIKYTLP